VTPARMPFVERSLLALLVAEPRLAGRAVEEVPEAWIRHPAAREAWRAIVADPEGDVSRWCESAAGAGRALLTSLASETDAAAEPEKAWDDHLRRLEYDVNRQELSRLMGDLARAPAESQEAHDLMGVIEELSVRTSKLRNHSAVQGLGKGEIE
jgi:DNA primase DnaG-like protein